MKLLEADLTRRVMFGSRPLRGRRKQVGSGATLEIAIIGGGGNHCMKWLIHNFLFSMVFCSKEIVSTNKIIWRPKQCNFVVL